MNKIIRKMLLVLASVLVVVGLIPITISAEDIDCTTQTNPCELNHDQLYTIAVDYSVELNDSNVHVYKNGDTSTDYYATPTSQGGTFFEIKGSDQSSVPENHLGFYARSQCSGPYEIIIKDTNGTEHKYYVTVNNDNPDPGPSSPYTFEDEGKKYLVGAANGSGTGDTLHIDGGSRFDLNPNDREFSFFIGVAEVNDSGQYNGSAPQDIINDVIDDISVTSNNTELITIGDISNFDFPDKSVSPGPVKTKSVKYTVKGNKSGDALITISFNYKGSNYSVNYICNVVEVTRLDIYVENDLDGVSGNGVIEKLNTIFASDDSYKSFIQSKTSKIPDDNTEVTFKFDGTKQYTGIININCPSANIIFTTKDYNSTSYNYFPTLENLIIYKYDEVSHDSDKAKIIGGINNNGGLKRVENLVFEASDTNKINNQKIGIYTSASASEDQGMIYNDIYNIFECNFTGYDVAVYCKDVGLTSGFKYCFFENNKNAILIDSGRNNTYSDSFCNTFVDNGVAINIVRRPREASALHFVFNYNYFFGSGTDYKLGSNELNGGTMFFNYSYYGTDYSNGFKNDNFRGSVVEYENGCPGIITTGPCVRYPENNVKLGFDSSNTGANKLQNGQTVTVNAGGLRNDSISIGVFDMNTESDLGSLEFGGNN